MLLMHFKPWYGCCRVWFLPSAAECLQQLPVTHVCIALLAIPVVLMQACKKRACSSVELLWPVVVLKLGDRSPRCTAGGALPANRITGSRESGVMVKVGAVSR